MSARRAGGAAGGQAGAGSPGNADDEGGGPGVAGSEYFRAIEDAFVRLRGAPLLLSPADYQVASRWHREGMPLRLIVATLEEVFARRRERGATGRINSLRYCVSAVEAAWAEVQALQGPARRAVVDEVPVGERLAALVAALPEGLAGRDEWERRLVSLGGAPEEVERSLRELDEELLAAAEAGLDVAGRDLLDTEVEEILGGLRKRFPDAELVQLRGQLRRQRLRRRAGIPVLSLF